MKTPSKNGLYKPLHWAFHLRLCRFFGVPGTQGSYEVWHVQLELSWNRFPLQKLASTISYMSIYKMRTSWPWWNLLYMGIILPSYISGLFQPYKASEPWTNQYLMGPHIVWGRNQPVSLVPFDPFPLTSRQAALCFQLLPEAPEMVFEAARRRKLGHYMIQCYI